MRIRLDRAVIFVHVPKTAGNSITAALDAVPPQRIPWDLRIARKCRRALGRSGDAVSKHSKAADIRRSLGRYTWSRCYSFAVVRNPWDLMVSSYFWWLQKASRWEHLRADAEAVQALGSFAAFMHSYYGQRQVNEVETDVLDYVTDTDGRRIVSFVARFEQLEAGWSHVCRAAGLGTVALPHANRGDHGDFRAYYDQETRALVSRRFRRYIDAFGYAFE